MLELKNIYKTYSSKNGVTHRALENVSLKFEEKGLVFILGKSGSGKSTLLNLIGGIDNFDRGDIIFNGKSFLNFKEKDYDHYRNTCIGFVFQEFNLIDNLTVFDNVSLALDLQSKKYETKVLDMLKQMEVDKLKNRPISDLAGGQRQRVSIARALIKNPKIILADEPTGSLDSETSDAIINILKDLSKERLVIVVTHNKELAYDYGDRIIEIRDGFVLKDLMRKEIIDEVNVKSTLVSSNLVIVPKNQEISDECINDLNVTISEKRQDYYILIDSNKNRAMSLYPNVKEVINDENNKEVFQPYQYKESNLGLKDNQREERINSNLPMKKAFKFSMSGLKKKKLRLFFTTVLAILSVIITGTAMNFSNYSLTGSIAKSIKEDNGSFIEVSSSFAVSDEQYSLQQKDINYLNSLDKNIAYEYNHALKLGTKSANVNSALGNDVLFPNRTLKGFLQCNDIEEFAYAKQNFKVIYEKEDLTEEDFKTGGYISSVVANTIIKTIDKYAIPADKQKLEIENIEDLLGYQFNFDSAVHNRCQFVILGIFDFDNQESLYNKFDKLHYGYTEETKLAYETLKSEYEEISNSILLRFVVNSTFMEHYKKENKYFLADTTIRSVFNQKLDNVNKVLSLSNYDTQRKTASYFFVNKANGNIISSEVETDFAMFNFEEYVKNMERNEIVVGSSLFIKLVSDLNSFPYRKKELIKEKIEEFNANPQTIIIANSKGTNGEVYQALENVKIVGVIHSNMSVDNDKRGVYINDEAFSFISNSYYQPNKAIIKMNKNDNFNKLIDNLYDNGFVIDNEFVSHFVSFSSTMNQFSSVINIATGIWFVIVTLLLYSFISSSIKDNSKEIGILKALGANIKDIYKIYMIEALLIGVLACVFGVVGFYFLGVIVNDLISKFVYTFYFTLFRFDIFSVIIMVSSIFIILAASLIIPISKIKGIKPIDVMKD